jgi:hypothetical protein
MPSRPQPGARARRLSLYIRRAGEHGLARETEVESYSKQAMEKTMEPASRFQKICVFCGSSQGKKTSYQDAAVDLAKELVYIYSWFYYCTSSMTFDHGLVSRRCSSLAKIYTCIL